ncbi:MAG: hypothetical protein RLZZ417_1471 [Bacteroidota bacterium]
MLIKWKKINCKSLPRYFLFYLSILLILNGCEQDLKEGCLDYRYINFSVDADVNCLDCCKLPELRILIRHRISQLDSIYPINYLTQPYSIPSGDTFFIENLSFILSDFRLIDLEMKEIPSLDSIQIRTVNTQNDSVFFTFPNSFLIGNPNLFQKKKVAAIFHNGKGIQGLKFHLGLNSSVNVLNPFNFTAGHPLNTNQNFLFQKDKGYIFANMELKWKEKSKNFPSNFSLSGNEYNKMIELPVFTNMRAGFNQEITIEVDYAKWFNSIDFSKDSPEIIRKKWLYNLVTSFSVVTVVEQID